MAAVAVQACTLDALPDRGNRPAPVGLPANFDLLTFGGLPGPLLTVPVIILSAPGFVVVFGYIEWLLLRRSLVGAQDVLEQRLRDRQVLRHGRQREDHRATMSSAGKS